MQCAQNFSNDAEDTAWRFNAASMCQGMLAFSVAIAILA